MTVLENQCREACDVINNESQATIKQGFMQSEASLKVVNILYNHVTTLLEIVLIDDEMKSNEFERILDTIQELGNVLMEAADKGDMHKMATHYLIHERLDVGDLINIATPKGLEMSQVLVSDQYTPWGKQVIKSNDIFSNIMIDLYNTRVENDRYKIEEIIYQMDTVVNSCGNNNNTSAEDSKHESKETDVLLAKQYECITVGSSNIHDLLQKPRKVGLTSNWQMMENDYRLSNESRDEMTKLMAYISSIWSLLPHMNELFA